MDTNCKGDSHDLIEHGILVEELSSWQEFHERVTSLRTKRGYIWRGQQRDKDDKGSLLLVSSFDRCASCESESYRSRKKLLDRHFMNFKDEMRRCHPDVLPESPDDIWALGQHYGLKTPLLDWSLSPYIAAYFAFEKPRDPDDAYRYVYALKRSITRLLTKPKKGGKEISRDSTVGVVDKLTHPSPRFIAQRGIFTKALVGDSIERAVEVFAGKRPQEVPILVKFKIPTKYRDECLRHLNLVNINHTSLLLDLRDVAEACNKKLEPDRQGVLR